ncbi:MAG: acyl-ACP--UDP-N-acetylglucosamine O-acyltransferase [Campylobacterales bacterium]|nr:acyl-ACP--UDP-N-acetylglucosamine O-acyltransferase [Campylobacterales bacterium]
MQSIHESSIIEKGAKIGNDVAIGPFCRIGSNVTIGDGTTIASHVVIEGKTTLGKNNRVFSHTVLGSIPQDLKFHGEEVELIFGDNNTIREFCFITPGTQHGGGVTRVGNSNLIMGYVHLGHDVIMGDNCIISNATNVGGHVEFGSYVVVGATSAIHQFVKIGDYAMLGGASALTQDLPPYCIAEGNRAYLRGLNLVGLRRHIEKNEIDPIKKAYRELFESSVALKESATRLIEQNPIEKVKNLCNFVLKTQRGVPYKRQGLDEKE